MWLKLKDGTELSQILMRINPTGEQAEKAADPTETLQLNNSVSALEKGCKYLTN